MKRKLRNYRIEESYYRKAMERAKSEGVKLSLLIEEWVKKYGEPKKEKTSSLT